MTEQAVGPQAGQGDLESGNRPTRVRLGAVVAVAVAVAVVLWLVLGGSGNSTQSQNGGGASSSAAGPRANSFPAHTTTIANSPQALIRGVDLLHRLAFWKGPKPNTSYALTRTTQGWIFISYMPPGAKLTYIHKYPFVATFLVKNAYHATLVAAQRSGSVRLSAPSGAVAFYYRRYPTSAYLAFKGSSEQIEVFDPGAGRVQALISSGTIRPVATGHP
jgi:hypothetical protein